jgi:hypothetical protein
MTLLEVLTASALFALLLGGMASSVYLARMTAYEAGHNSTTASDISAAFLWMSQDIAEAVSIEQATDDQLAITVLDRDSDGDGETILFSWDGHSLGRRLNNGSLETLIDGLSTFDFSYALRSTTTSATAVYGPEQLLMAHNSSSDLGNSEVDGKKHKGQYIEPVLPGDAISWIATKVRLRMRSRGSVDGEATVQFRSAIGNLPGGEILAEAVLAENTLPSAYSWVEISLGPAHEPIPAGTGACLIVKGTGIGDACELLYQDDHSTAAGTEFVQSLDGGARWSAPPERDLIFELYGRVGTPATNLTESYLKQITFRAGSDSAGVVYGSARALNEPKVGN